MERFWRFIAWRLPLPLVKWCAVRWDEQEAGAKAFEDLNGPALIEAVEKLDGGHDEAGKGEP